MRRKVIGVIAAVVLALVGTVVLASYVQGAEDRAKSGEEVVDVLVVSRSVNAGTPSEDLTKRVQIEQVPAKVRADDAIDDLEDVEGQVASVDLVPGEQLVRTRFVVPQNFEDRRTAVARVPDGFHEVTVKLEPERALAGQLQAGDTVAFTASFDPVSIVGDKAFGILTEGMTPEEKAQFIQQYANPADGSILVPGDMTGNVTHMTIHKMVVTDVSLDPSTRRDYDDVDVSEDDTTGAAPSGDVFVTFAAEAPTVERIVFATEFGRIWLSYEPPESPEEGTEFVYFSNFFDDLETIAVEEGK